MESLEELEFTGRLTKQELISIRSDGLRSKPVNTFFSVLSLLLAVLFYHAPVKPNEESLKVFLVTAFAILGGIPFLIRMVCALRIYSVKAQEQDSTIRLAPDKISVDGIGGFSRTYPVNEIAFGKNSHGIKGKLKGFTIFLLPYRILSQDQIKAIERMYNLTDLGQIEPPALKNPGQLP